MIFAKIRKIIPHRKLLVLKVKTGATGAEVGRKGKENPKTAGCGLQTHSDLKTQTF